MCFYFECTLHTHCYFCFFVILIIIIIIIIIIMVCCRAPSDHSSHRIVRYRLLNKVVVSIPRVVAKTVTNSLHDVLKLIGIACL